MAVPALEMTEHLLAEGALAVVPATVRLCTRRGQGDVIMAEATDQVSVPAEGTATHRVFGGRAGDLSRISHCDVQRRADADE